jgi:hypothetical protein
MGTSKLSRRRAPNTTERQQSRPEPITIVNNLLASNS